MQAARDPTESSADMKLKPLEFRSPGSKGLKCIAIHSHCVQPEKVACRRNHEPFELDAHHLDDKHHFVEDHYEIVGREVKRLKRSRIPLVKVRWNSKRGPEFTWEREDQFKKKNPHLFTKTTSSSSATS
ncbi:hypothetical protein Tco_0563711 [Tanacetum coccineum]